MDSNGLRFWMLSDSDDWLPPAGSDTLSYCTERRRLQLRSVRSGSPPLEDFSTASALLETAPIATDTFGNYARWDSGSGHVMAGGSGAGEVPIYAPPALEGVTDLVMGYDGVLYVAIADTLVLIDRRDRWPNFTLSVADFKFWRLAPLAGGGVLALDRTQPQLAKVTGLPLQTAPSETPNPGILSSCQQNPNPPQIAARWGLPGSETFVAIAPMDSGQFALLAWDTAAADNREAYLHLFTEAAGAGARLQLGGVRLPYSITCLGDTRVAVLASGINEAMIYDMANQGAALAPAGETYLLADRNLGPFAHVFNPPPYYARGAELLPLAPLSLNSLAGSGTAADKIVDSGAPQTVWHRVFLEAVVPPRCGAVVWLAASDKSTDISGGTAPWFPHVLGAADTSALPPGTPRAVWQPVSTEAPFGPPLLGDAPIKDRQGLFQVLVQRVGKAVRKLSGRYLGIRVQLNGDRRSTPEIAALRAYGSRFSYVDHYLPEIYRENKFGPDADKDSVSTRRDFFDRFVNLFEAQLTRIEDCVANAYLVTRPESSPDAALDWLGGWIGIAADSYPPDRRRARLLGAPQLYRQRGTTAGIVQAIDIATNGLCSRGAVLVIEAFRLRHLFATILGADLSIQNDPLLPGYSGSGNSFVGDTLFLGDPHNLDFLALFAGQMLTERQQVQQFYDSLAHRLTVFVHDQVGTVDLNLVQRIVEQEKPAHVAATLMRATQPFLIGLASLAGVNTYLAPDPPREPATLDVSRIGRYDVITHLPSLDPRLENGQSFEFGQPLAGLKAPLAVNPGQAIPLDGSASTAPLGRSLSGYQWGLTEK